MLRAVSLCFCGLLTASAAMSSASTSSEQGRFPFDGYIERLKAFDSGLAKTSSATSAVSGIGSHAARVKPFISWLERWLREHKVNSLVEASCGHWASGWQTHVRASRDDTTPLLLCFRLHPGRVFLLDQAD